jgi:hypothetical protein
MRAVSMLPMIAPILERVSSLAAKICLSKPASLSSIWMSAPLTC